MGRVPANAMLPSSKSCFGTCAPTKPWLNILKSNRNFPEPDAWRLVLNARQVEASGTILIAIEDVTEHKRAQEELQRSTAAIRSLLEATPQSVLGVSEDQTIVLANGNTERMFGYKREDLIGKKLDLVIPESLRGRHAEHHKGYFADPRSRPMGNGLNLDARRKDGTVFPVEIGLSAIETATGKLAVAFVNDITQRRQMEQVAQTHAQEVHALAASLLTAQEEERRRVSRELHDQICQQLASLAIDMGGLAVELSRPNLQARLAALQTRVVQASEQTRHIAYELHPSVLDDLGLVLSLKALCHEFSKQAGIPVKFKGAIPSRVVPREVASCVYRIAQQSLDNIYKHSKAKHASVTLALHDHAFAMTVEDDGIGFDLQAVKGRGGLGLIGMEERALLVQGKLSIESRPGHGTRIAIEVPLPASGL